MAAFRESREVGNAWGKLIKEQLSNQNSAAYKELSRNIPEFENYSIYHQVQFCLKGDCKSQGNYWIPDFVLVREVQNPVTGIKHLETIVIDTKLSAATDWTKNPIARICNPCVKKRSSLK